MDKEKLYNKYYKRLDVKYEIIKFLKNREFCLMSSKNKKIVVRNMRVHNTQHLDKWLYETQAEKQLFNIYYSVASFAKGVPYFKNGLDLKTRLIYNYMDTCKGYAFILDIDASDFKISKISTLLIHDFFNKHKIPHEIRFTGHGFHVVVPEQFTESIQSINNIKDLQILRSILSQFALWLHDNITETIDLQVYDERRFIKVPFSLIFQKKGIYWCSPIYSTQQLKNCKLSDFEFSKYPPTIRGKGTYIFNQFLDPNFSNLQKLIYKKIKRGGK
jgi:hypothetical protein